MKSRLELRNISKKTGQNIFEKSQEFYWDNLRNHHIAVGRVRYKGKIRKMLAAYDKIGDTIELITIHPITDEEINQRIKSGRWIYEKEQN
ncbi:hypothetical protein HYU95_02505 [Candidatus Daviesbacteria bacterium]|nr:hypothetical protein [Candidatus Daviesbacteria bacterium]